MARQIQFDELPQWMQEPIKLMRGSDYATWIYTPVPALGNRSVTEVLGEGAAGERELREYLGRVMGYFFDHP